MTLKHTYMVLAVATTMTACNDYLDKMPSKSSSTPVETAANLLAVYDYVTNRYTTNYFALFATDDEDLPRQMYASSPSTFAIDYVVAPYVHYRDGIIANTSDLLWESEYKRIYEANLMVNTSVTGTDDERREALSCGYFMRAYSLFELATFYCMPWSEANKGELGVPLRLGTDYEENISRGTLGQTYDQIFADLDKAEANAVYDAVPSMPWRVSRCAVNALRARIHLARGEFEKALDYANRALSIAPEPFDLNTLSWGTPGTMPTNDFWTHIADSTGSNKMSYSETNSWNLRRILYDYTEWIYADLTQNRTQLITPSEGLMSLYDKDNDLRFAHFFVEHGTARMTNIEYDAYRYNPWYDGRYISSGLTTSEILLVKAECQVRLGQWQEGLATLTPLRLRRFATGTATPLTAGSQAEALKEVLKERRRELPFYHRFGDIKRFSQTADTSDDVTVTREFYDVSTTRVDTSAPKTWTIPGNSRAWAMPIYQTEINSAKGAIEQNPE